MLIPKRGEPVRLARHRDHRPGPAARCTAAAMLRERHLAEEMLDIPFALMTPEQMTLFADVVTADEETACGPRRPEAGV